MQYDSRLGKSVNEIGNAVNNAFETTIDNMFKIV